MDYFTEVTSVSGGLAVAIRGDEKAMTLFPVSGTSIDIEQFFLNH